MGEIFHLNGKLQNASEVGIDPSDQGFLYGAGLFETMRAYYGRIFLLDRHVNRLLASAPVIGVETLDTGKLKEACRSVVTANGLDNARVRLTVSRGISKVFPQASGQPTILAQAQAYTPPALEKYRRGYRAKVSEIRRYSKSLISCYKTTNFLECLLARTRADAGGYDEALFLNENGNLTEGSMSNFFLVYGDRTLNTPPLDAGLLPGITRQFVLEIAGKLGMEVLERNVNLKDLADVNEAFVTSSLIEIMPLASITDEYGREFRFRGSDTTDRLRKFYLETVNKAGENWLPD
jgi:branched-subunit amino acid aminotransferase/4-amino-4-deoxychorismate lyase